MIKRFVSNALLSLVMDKSAREKLAQRSTATDTARKLRSDSAMATPTARAQSAAIDQTDLSDPDAPRAVRVRSPGAVRAEDSEDPLAIIEDALSEARQSLGMEPRPASAPAKRSTARATTTPTTGVPQAGSDRERLIAEALSIHAKQSQMLDELDDDMRDKLRLMAIKALDPEAFEKIKAEALAGKPRRPRR